MKCYFRNLIFLSFIFLSSSTLAAWPSSDEFSFNADVIETYVKKHAVPFSVNAVSEGSPQVLIFGEAHPRTAPKHLLIREMPALAAAGFTHLALEMVNSSDQEMLDLFAAGKISRSVVEERLRPSDYWGWRPELYVDVMEAALANGLSLLALDARDLVGDFQFPKDLHERNRHMASVLANFITSNPEARAVMLTGTAHAQATGSPNLLPAFLQDRGVSYRSFSVDIGEKNPRRRTIVEHCVVEAGFSTENLLIRLPREKAHFDGYIYVDSLETGEPDPFIQLLDEMLNRDQPPF